MIKTFPSRCPICDHNLYIDNFLSNVNLICGAQKIKHDYYVRIFLSNVTENFYIEPMNINNSNVLLCHIEDFSKNDPGINIKNSFVYSLENFEKIKLLL